MRPKRSNRVLTALATVALVAGGGAWSGCGDDEEDQAQQIIEDAQQELDEGLDKAEQEGEEAEKELDRALEDSGSGSGY